MSIAAKNVLSFIEDDEVAQAKESIIKAIGFEPPRVTGPKMCIKLFIREEGEKLKNDKGEETSLVTPDSISQEDKYRTVTGLVISQGSDCYKGERFKDSGPWCKVGDFVAFPRHAGNQYLYRGLAVHIIYDDAIDCVLEDPSHLSKY